MAFFYPKFKKFWNVFLSQYETRKTLSRDLENSSVSDLENSPQGQVSMCHCEDGYLTYTLYMYMKIW